MSRSGETKIMQTKGALLEAYCRLGEQRPPEEITVSALCREAGVNRTTFYKYYDVPNDVIVEKTGEILESALLYEEGGRIDEEGSIRNICRLCYENVGLLRLYMTMNAELAKIVFRIIRDRGAQYEFLAKSENIFLSGGILQVTGMWMLQGCRETPEEMAKLLLHYIRVFREACAACDGASADALKKQNLC